MTASKRSQAECVKQSYQTTNWPEYEASLRQRGSLTVWISEDERSRTLQGQRVEARVGFRILNTMAGLRMPESHRVD